MSHRANHPARPDWRLERAVDAILGAARARLQRRAAEQQIDTRVSIETDEQGFTIVTTSEPRQCAVWHKDREQVPTVFAPDVPTPEFLRTATRLRKASN